MADFYAKKKRFSGLAEQDPQRPYHGSFRDTGRPGCAARPQGPADGPDQHTESTLEGLWEPRPRQCLSERGAGKHGPHICRLILRSKHTHTNHQHTVPFSIFLCCALLTSTDVAVAAKPERLQPRCQSTQPTFGGAKHTHKPTSTHTGGFLP